ncbi:ferritin-like domain-containing protein [Patulibacter sp. NPDC049589]|uniref:ferritin-like domain-containing protein n=1 Tax=Patulibacter sp. NPDC049589 TaxID=3154731 RepID=UPI00342AFA99
MAQDPDVSTPLYDIIDRQHEHLSASSRRSLVKGTAAAIGGLGLFGMMSGTADAATTGDNSPESIASVAATAEVLATIVNTVGPEKLGDKLDPVTKLNIQAAAQQEKNHYELLTSSTVGGTAVTKTIYVPDEVFASKENLLKTLVVGDQIFINAYLIATTVFARRGDLMGSRFSRYTAEIMATEAVHRALALQSLGQLGNDRVYAKFSQKEETPGILTTNFKGFQNVTNAVGRLEAAGFGFGKPGSKPGQAYEYDVVSARTPTVPGVNTIAVA